VCVDTQGCDLLGPADPCAAAGLACAPTNAVSSFGLCSAPLGSATTDCETATGCAAGLACVPNPGAGGDTCRAYCGLGPNAGRRDCQDDLPCTSVPFGEDPTPGTNPDDDPLSLGWGLCLPKPANLCEGLITDTAAHPMTSSPKPGYLAATADPVFGTTIRRITNVSAAEGENAVIIPMYSTVQAWNADESKLILWHRGTGHELYDGRTYAFLRTLPISPTDLEHVLWDPVDPDLLYYPTNYNAVPNLMRYRVSTNSIEVLRNFEGPPTSCPLDWGQLLSLGTDPQYLSWGPTEKIVGLRCGPTKFLYDIGSDTVLAVKSFPASTTAPIPGPSGALAYFEGGVYDRNLSLLRTLDMASTVEHANVGRSAAGYDTYNAVSFDDALNGSLVTFNLATGERTVVVGPSRGYPYPPSGTHLSAVATGNPGWVAVSMVGDPSGQCVLCQEILLARPETLTVCRVAHHHSKGPEGGVWGYWAEPHNVISPSGTRILFGSDWEDGPVVDSYVVELPSYR
jgi:hypothetical protein